MVKGTQIAFEDSELNSMTNWTNVRRYYKLGVGGQAKGRALVNGGGPGMPPADKEDLEIQVLGAMALRGIS